MKHVLASQKDKKPTILNKDLEKEFPLLTIFSDEIKLFYPMYKCAITYTPSRMRNTWYAKQQLPDDCPMPKVGAPVNLEVSQYIELVDDQFDYIREWATQRNLLQNGDIKTQYIKLNEEVGELAESILKNDEQEFADAIGDIVVVLTNLAALKNIKIEDCINLAYNTIKNRSGKIVNNTFVKNEN